MSLEESSGRVRTANGLDFGVCDADVTYVIEDSGRIRILLGLDNLVELGAVDVGRGDVGRVTAVATESRDEVGVIFLLDETGWHGFDVDWVNKVGEDCAVVTQKV